MAEDTLSKIIRQKMLPFKPCVTRNLKIHGYEQMADPDPLAIYGTDRMGIKKLMDENESWKIPLSHETGITPAQVIWAIRHEMALTVEDVLARRTRILFIDAQVAYNLAPRVAAIMMKEMNKDEEWKEKQIASFLKLSEGYLLKEDHLES
jgi:glycerol-3-phosphate dehydrogenase